MNLTIAVTFLSSLLVLAATPGHAQAQPKATQPGAAQPGAAQDDTWGKFPPASDDRFSNPKSMLYAGPNGWFNFGEVRAVVSNPAKTSYGFKGGFNLITHSFHLAESNKLQVLTLDFGTDRPAVGEYQLSGKADPAKKKVHVSFADVSNQKLRAWASADQAGTLTVSLVNGFLYFKCRNVQLQPTGLHNTGDLKHPMTLGFEGAIAPE